MINLENSLVSPFVRNKAMVMLAFDHRGSFKKMMEAQGGEASEEMMIELKRRIMEAVEGKVSGVLIDQDYGLPAFKALGLEMPFLLPIEKSGYSDEAGERVTEIGYTAESIKEEGALGIKLLLYVNPNLQNSWAKQMQTAKEVIIEGGRVGLPVFLEFVMYEALDKEPGLVSEAVRQALGLGVKPDVWKLPYPGSAEECRQVSLLAGETPWILLTGGGDFESFAEESAIAFEAGAVGCLAGRSLWQEATSLYQEEEKLVEFLNITLVERVEKIKNIFEK